MNKHGVAVLTALLLCGLMIGVVSAAAGDPSGLVPVTTPEELKNNLTGGNSVILMNEISVTETIVPKAETEITLDLNGFNITKSSAGELFQITNKAGLTITDSGDQGRILTSKTAITVQNGTLDVQSGTITRGEISSVGDYGSLILIIGSAIETNGNPYSQVTIGQNAVVEGYAHGIGITYPTGSSAAYGVVLDVYGTVGGSAVASGKEGYYGSVGITVNGNIQTTDGSIPEITIHDGAVVTGYCGNSGNLGYDDGPAVYAAGYANWTINGGTFAGDEALGIKAGKFTINGGTFTANGAFFDPSDPNGNGSEATGAAVSITKHDSYSGAVELTILDGEFTSDLQSALFECTSKEQTGTALQKVAISGGTFRTDNDTLSPITIHNSNDVTNITGGISITDSEGVDLLYPGVSLSYAPEGSGPAEFSVEWLNGGLTVTEDGSYRLMNDTQLGNSMNVIGCDIAFDLNGKTLGASYDGTEERSVIKVGTAKADEKATLVIQDLAGNGAIISKEYGIFVRNSSKVTVDSVNITGGNRSALTGNANGNFNDAEFVVTGSSRLISTDHSAMFVPALGSKVTINDTVYIEGKSGLALCSGTVDISDNVVINATGELNNDKPEDGPLNSGAAIDLHKYTASSYPGDIILTIGGNAKLMSAHSAAISNYVNETSTDKVDIFLEDTAVFEGYDAVLSTKNYTGEEATPKGNFTLNGGLYNYTASIGNVLVNITPIYLEGKSMSPARFSDGYFHVVEKLDSVTLHGPTNVTPNVKVIFNATVDGSADTYVWKVNSQQVTGFAGNSIEYTFNGTDAVQVIPIEVTASNRGGVTVTNTTTVYVDKEKAVPTEETGAVITPSSGSTLVPTIIFSTEDAGATITVAVEDKTAEKEDTYKVQIPNIVNVLKVLNVTVTSAVASDVHDLKQMAVLKFSVKLNAPLEETQIIQAFRFVNDETTQIAAMPLKTEFIRNTSAGVQDYTYDCTVYTPGFSDIVPAVVTGATPVPPQPVPVNDNGGADDGLALLAAAKATPTPVATTGTPVGTSTPAPVEPTAVPTTEVPVQPTTTATAEASGTTAGPTATAAPAPLLGLLAGLGIAAVFGLRRK